MIIKSSAFEEGKSIPEEYTCDADNVNPPLEISNVPKSAKSLALIVDDPDSPTGTFLHWMIWNLSPDLKEIIENDWPEGSEQGINGAEELGYSGPCPPEGMHHYHFKLYALNKLLDVPNNINKEKLEKEIESSLIEKAELIGTYSRNGS